MEEPEHGRDRDKKAVGDNTDGIEEQGGNAPQRAEERPDDGDKNEREGEEDHPDRGDECVIIRQHARTLPCREF